MKKIAEFLVNKRIYIFILMIVLTIISVFFVFRTKINYDLTKYLPVDSEMKMGLTIMDEEFDDEETSSLKIVITDLDLAEKAVIHDLLQAINTQVSVNYDNTAQYNQGIYTLYYLTVPDEAHSELAKNVYQTSKTALEEYDAYFSGDIPDAQSNFLFTLIAWGFALLLILLIFLAKSWFEALIFIVTIGIAVIINYGTNMIFSSVSEITFSIAAVLQLVLSIDYSIMLSERYRQEKATGLDHVTAMKNAISKGMSSISAASITTMLGLLCLVFMSFTIGLDMGLVLAKGIFFSFLTTLTVLPMLLIVFDKTIEKTQKHPNIKVKFDQISHFEFKHRYYVFVIFLMLIAGGITLNQYVGVDFFVSSMANDALIVEEHFPTENEMVILYKNEDESKIQSMINAVLLMDGTISIQSYQTTFGEQQSSAELSVLMGLDETIVKMIIYQYYDGLESTLTIHQFVSFILSDISINPAFKSFFTVEDIEQLTYVQNFTSIPFITDRYNAAELSAMLSLDETQTCQLIMMYYTSKGEEISETVVLFNFVEFLVEVSNDPLYSDSFTVEQKYHLSSLYNLMGLGYMNNAYHSTDLATIFASMMPQFETSMVPIVYWIHDAMTNYDDSWKISIDDFITYIVTDLMFNQRFSAMMDESMVAELNSSYQSILIGKRQLIGPNYSRMILTSSLSLSDDEAIPYVNSVSETLENLAIEYYLIGNLPMADEMNDNFLTELNFITILTIIVIFIIVAITFKSLFVPLLLVAIIQTSIYLTMSVNLIVGKDLYFLSIIVVQAILMGAAIDYAILFTNYYRNARKNYDIKTSVSEAYKGALPAILTSSIILIVITFILGFVVENATTSSVLMTLSRGMSISVLMTLLILPPMLALFDKWVCHEITFKKKKAIKN